MTSRLHSKRNRRMSRSKPGAACLPNTDRLHPLKRSTPTEPICSAILATSFDDRRGCQYAYGSLILLDCFAQRAFLFINPREPKVRTHRLELRAIASPKNFIALS